MQSSEFFKPIVAVVTAWMLLAESGTKTFPGDCTVVVLFKRDI
ncbi:hypothetical protein RIEGSTA812A_PEG_351 [invertebrate metagenome]|uniref:Uncharacterized protein n=1 Tax=invertebrate metagenome TaxID=1711999 RepID=A0A484H9N8_9ZZZZ